MKVKMKTKKSLGEVNRDSGMGDCLFKLVVTLYHTRICIEVYEYTSKKQLEIISN
jgi:hypothetical protein